MKIFYQWLIERWTCRISAAVPVLASSATAGAAASGFFASITALDVISGVVTAFGVLSELRQGAEESRLLKNQAQLEDLRAKREAVAGKQAENDAREKLVRALAQNIAAAGASGIDIGSGTIQTGLGEILNAGSRELSVARSNTLLEVANRKAQAGQLRIQASQAKAQAGRRAAFGLLDFARQRAERGQPPEGPKEDPDEEQRKEKKK